MTRPRALPAVLVAAAAATALGWPAGGPPAVAGCVAPVLTVDGRPADGRPADGRPADDRPAPRLRAGSPVVVRGQYLLEGCDDTGGSGGGCSAPQAAPRRPMEDVVLRVRQDGRTRDLGAADADAEGAASWAVTLPRDLRPGRAVLTTGVPGEPLVVRVSR